MASRENRLKIKVMKQDRVRDVSSSIETVGGSLPPPETHH